MNFNLKADDKHPLINYIGPDLNLGKMAAIIYFAVSKEESLTLDPFNQPVNLLQGDHLRIFSFTLPSHGEGFDKMNAMQSWADETKKNPLFFSEFIKSCSSEIDALIQEEIIDPKNLAILGLSRGGFLALHLAAKNEKIKTVLNFSPLINLDYLEEFKNSFNYKSFNASHLTEKLIGKQLRFYSGNRDIRVGTECSFEFIKELTDEAYESGIRSPKVELIIYPSIGAKGHGTPPHIFEDGAKWLLSKLNV